MGSGKNKRQETQLNNRVDAAITNVKTESPLEKRLNARAERFFNWEDGTGEYANVPKDITQAPGMDAYLDVYGNAERLANAQRQAGGALNLANPASGAYGDQIRSLQSQALYDQRAAGLNEGLQGIRGEAYGLADAGINRYMNRNNAVAGLEQQRLASFYSKPKQPSIWSSIIGAGASIAGGYLAGRGG